MIDRDEVENAYHTVAWAICEGRRRLGKDLIRSINTVITDSSGRIDEIRAREKELGEQIANGDNHMKSNLNICFEMHGEYLNIVRGMKELKKFPRNFYNTPRADTLCSQMAKYLIPSTDCHP